MENPTPVKPIYFRQARAPLRRDGWCESSESDSFRRIDPSDRSGWPDWRPDPFFGGRGVCQKNQWDEGMILIWPPPCNSDHQDYYMFSRGFLLTFTFHCYREGAIPKGWWSMLLPTLSGWWWPFLGCFFLCVFSEKIGKMMCNNWNVEVVHEVS